MQSLMNGFADLLGETLLQLQPVAEYIHHTGNLAQTRYHAIGDICNMDTTIEGQHVVLAKRVEVYILDDDHLIAPFLVKDGTLKNCYRILLIT
jgi:hypothetical protein